MGVVASTAASFVISYLANNVPVVVNVSLQSRIKKCYNEARKEWKCTAVREKYEGKELLYLDDLKLYVSGRLDSVDSELQELLSRWAIKMQNDPVCSSYLNSLKLTELLSGAKEYPNLFVELLVDMSDISDQLDSIKSSLDNQDKILEQLLGGNTTVIDLLKQNQSQIASIPGISRQPRDIDSIIQRYMDQSVGNDKIVLEPVPCCSSAIDTRVCLYDELIEESVVFDHFVCFLCCRGGLSWYTNKPVNGLLYDTAKKIETFANQNRFYLSDEAYGLLRQHYNSATDLCNAIELFYVSLENGFEKEPDRMTDVVDSIYGQQLQIGPEFVVLPQFS